MRIICLSDLHGHLPEVPDCDLLLLGGDYPPMGMHLCKNDEIRWHQDYFKPWIDSLGKRMKIVGVAGNHDFAFQEMRGALPLMDWTYLEDNGIEWNGLKIWGSPWQPVFGWWAFNAKEDDLKQKWDRIPDDTDILVLHGPPHGYGDYVGEPDGHSGSPSLLKRIEVIRPKLVIAGHIHSGYGKYQIGETVFVNASYVDEKRKPTHEIIVVDL